MVSERNGFIELVNYFESLGIDVNIGKNKARGNQGLFIAKQNQKFRIDISRNVDDSSKLAIMLHEFAHYVHYRYDSSLKTLDFVFDDISDAEMEELLRVTVEKVPKSFAQVLYDKKDEFSRNVKSLSAIIRKYYPDFKLSSPFKTIEKNINYPAKYLLKYDRIKYLNKIYSIENLEKEFEELSECQYAYIKLKANQRHIAKINSRINRLNKYYSATTELWARFCELFFTNSLRAEKLAPILSSKFKNTLSSNKIKELSIVNEILHTF